MNKARTLQLLKTSLSEAVILPLIILTKFEIDSGINVQEYVTKNLGKYAKYIVRSNYENEDKEYESNAGRYLTKLNLNLDEVEEAIVQVLNSYDSESSVNSVIIQPFLQDTQRSGVLFSHKPETGSTYLIDNFTLTSDTALITSGNRSGHIRKCFYNPRTKHNCGELLCMRLLRVVKECQEILKIEYLDIEYAISIDNDLVIFQVRPLQVHNLLNSSDSIVHKLNEIQTFIKNRSSRTPFLAGSSTVYAVMPDWNPAEMIGRKPKKLALSLYRELITDSIWAYQRDNYGYKSLRSFQLLVDLCSQPYIDARVSFNSLLPKGLNSEIEHKLIDYYIDKLKESRHLHDKVEFEIVLSSWTFDIKERISNLPTNFNQCERELLEAQLKNLTQKVIQGEMFERDIERIQKLQVRRDIILNEESDDFTRIYWLIEDCKRWGTLPFAGLARVAFIVTQIIKSLEKICGKRDLLKNITENVHSVISQMNDDIVDLDRDAFLLKYGHLRPGTYDITTPSYRENFNLYFGNRLEKKPELGVTQSVKEVFVDLASKYGLEQELKIKPADFLEFAQKAIFWREQSKFEFTKNLSTVLDILVGIGERFDIQRNDLAHLDIKELLSFYSSSTNFREIAIRSIEKGRYDYSHSLSIDLPSVICDASEIVSFCESDAKGNYITLENVTGQVTDKLNQIEGRIVLIPGADPGYDWIFQHKILGLITAFGGANSHMAIRCSELSIPAAIGIGERLYSEIQKSNVVRLDCAKAIIEYK
jgi:glutamine kinase